MAEVRGSVSFFLAIKFLEFHSLEAHAREKLVKMAIAHIIFRSPCP